MVELVTADKVPWVNISGQEFKDDLNAVLDDPTTIRQGETPWCGAGAAMYLAVKLDASGFKRNARDLYRTGTVEVGFGTYDLDASNDLFEEEVPNSSGIDNSASFIMMSTFKNENKIFDPHGRASNDLDPGDYDNQLIGVTLAREVVSYLTDYYNITYTEGDGYYDYWGWNPFDGVSWNPIQGIKDLQSQGNTVLLIVNSDKLNGSTGMTQHYLVVESIVKINNKWLIGYFNPKIGYDSKEFTQEEWEDVINWYGGFKKK